MTAWAGPPGRDELLLRLPRIEAQVREVERQAVVAMGDGRSPDTAAAELVRAVAVLAGR